jgi:hypothetical protein
MNSTIIIGIILLSGFIIPAFFVIRKQNRDKKLLEEFFGNIEKNHQMKVTEHESWRNRVIGIDNDKQKALYVIHDKTEDEIQVVDLRYVTACTVEKNVVTSEFNKSIQAVNSIRIRFRGRDKAHPDQVFILYSEEKDQNLGSELRIAEAWAERFNKLIRKISHAA